MEPREREKRKWTLVCRDVKVSTRRVFFSRPDAAQTNEDCDITGKCQSMYSVLCDYKFEFIPCSNERPESCFGNGSEFLCVSLASSFQFYRRQWKNTGKKKKDPTSFFVIFAFDQKKIRTPARPKNELSVISVVVAFHLCIM